MLTPVRLVSVLRAPSNVLQTFSNSYHSQDPTSSVEETAKAARQKARSEAERKASRARDVDALNPYSPLLPAWKQPLLPPKEEEDILRHLKFELTAMEEQVGADFLSCTGNFAFSMVNI